eukprot:gene10004-10158_t
MSIIHPSAIKAIAHSVDIPRLSDEAAKVLAPDVEYRLREVVQEALKFAKHAKRTTLTTEDINNALRLRNVEPLFGFGSKDAAKFLKVAGHPELVFVRDAELNYQQLIEAPLPKLPREVGVAAHWLCVNGQQPDLPENTPVEAPPAKKQRLGQTVAEAAAAGQDIPAAAPFAADPGLHPLVPYFAAFIADGVAQHLGDLELLSRLLQLTSALLKNPAVHLDAYLQQLLPAVVTCLVTKRIGLHPVEDHWAIRRQAAALLGAIAAHFGAPHHNLTPRLCRVLAQAFLDPHTSFGSKYGAVALGPQVVRTLLVPHLEPFMSAHLFKLHSKLPLELVLARSGRMAAPGDWKADYTHTLLAVKQAARKQPGTQQDLQGNTGGSAANGVVGADGSGDDVMHDARDVEQDKQMEAAAPMNGIIAIAGSSPISKQKQSAGQSRMKGAAGPTRLKGNLHRSSSAHQPTVAQVLGQSWREDSDVDATLGALLHLFGEDLLSCLPLAELSAVNL